MPRRLSDIRPALLDAGDTDLQTDKVQTSSRFSVEESAPIIQESFQPARSTLGRRLRDIRAKIVASGEPLLDWDGLKSEKAARRRYRDIHSK